MNNMVKRSDRVAFYEVMVGGQPKFVRMSGFTDMSISKNPKEYSRQYVDDEFSQSDVVGYSPSISYAFDMYTGNAVHEDIAHIAENELMGEKAVRRILFAEVSKADGYNRCPGVVREFSVIPDAEGSGTDTYSYAGTFKVRGEKVFCTAESVDGWQTCLELPEFIF